MKYNKARGPDNFPFRLFKHAIAREPEIICTIFSKSLKRENIPTHRQISQIN